MKCCVVNPEQIYAQYGKQMRKEGLTCASVDVMYAVVESNRVIGWAGVVIQSSKYVFKSAYVLPEHRGKGAYKELLRHRISLHHDKKIEATCTPMSVGFFVSLGFQVTYTYKNGCKKVTHAKNLR